MTQRPDRPQLSGEDRPVLTGLIALVSVGLAVGLVMGIVVLIAVHVSGIGGGDDTAAGDTNASLYLPRPAKTTAPSGPLITLNSDATASTSPTDEASEEPTDETTSASPEDGQISLSTDTSAVAPMEQIDLTGVYPAGEGAVLQVQRLTAGRWQDFPVTVVVSGGTFSTYVQTSSPGMNRFRVFDTDAKVASNDVRVKVG